MCSFDRWKRSKSRLKSRKHKNVIQSLYSLVPQNKSEFAFPLLNDSLSTSIAACFEHNSPKPSTHYGTVNIHSGRMHLYQFNFKPYCACRFQTVQFEVLIACYPTRGKRGEGRAPGESAEIGLVFIARFIKPIIG